MGWERDLFGNPHRSATRWSSIQTWANRDGNLAANYPGHSPFGAGSPPFDSSRVCPMCPSPGARPHRMLAFLGEAGVIDEPGHEVREDLL
jgi:hypothetical protein